MLALTGLSTLKLRLSTYLSVNQQLPSSLARLGWHKTCGDMQLTSLHVWSIVCVLKNATAMWLCLDAGRQGYW